MAPEAVSHISGASAQSGTTWDIWCEQQKEEYVRSIRPEDVCALASYHRNGDSCVQFQEPERDTYNVYYFVEFPRDGSRWVVRFPLAPVLYDLGRKMQSEISTMEYVASKTTIPVPHLHAYGFTGSESGNVTRKCFIILEHIPGKPLDMAELFEATETSRQRFYNGLAHFYSQLRTLEFDMAGVVSLDEDGTFKITPPITADLNDAYMLQRGIRASDYPATKSTESYIGQLHSLLLHRATDSVREMGLYDVQYLVFALQDFEQKIRDLYFSPNTSKFVLHHSDICPSDIIVDDDFHVKGIRSWEWARTVPAQLFVPPIWLGKHILPTLNDMSFKDSLSKLCEAVASSGSPLATEWRQDMGSRAEYYIAAALLNQPHFLTIYFNYSFPIYFGDEKFHYKVRRFFEEDGPDGPYTRKVEALMRSQRRV